MTQGHSVRKQASTTLSYLRSWSRIQTQITARRLCMVTEGLIRQKKLENKLKLEAKVHDQEVRVVRHTFLQLWYVIFCDIMLVVNLFVLKNIAIPMVHLEVPSMNYLGWLMNNVYNVTTVPYYLICCMVLMLYQCKDCSFMIKARVFITVHYLLFILLGI